MPSKDHPAGPGMVGDLCKGFGKVTSPLETFQKAETFPHIYPKRRTQCRMQTFVEVQEKEPDLCTDPGKVTALPYLCKNPGMVSALF